MGRLAQCLKNFNLVKIGIFTIVVFLLGNILLFSEDAEIILQQSTSLFSKFSIKNSNTIPVFTVDSYGNTMVNGVLRMRGDIAKENESDGLTLCGGSMAQWGAYLKPYGYNTGGGIEAVLNGGDAQTGQFQIVNYKTANRILRAYQQGGVRIGNTDNGDPGANNLAINSLIGGGDVYSDPNGRLYNFSSSRDYKKEIKPIEINPDRILNLQLKSFVWKSDERKDIGYIAEEVKEVIPELYRDNGVVKGYDKDKLEFYVIELLKEQQKQIENLKSEVNELKIKLENNQQKNK